MRKLFLRSRSASVLSPVCLFAMFTAAMLMASVQPTHADVNWVAPNDGAYSDANNWDTGVAPGAGDVVGFQLDGIIANPLSVSFDPNANTQAAGLNVDTTALTSAPRTLNFQLNDGQFDLAGDANVGIDGTQRVYLILRQGKLQASKVDLGVNDGADGWLQVDNSYAALETSSTVTVGRAGRGTIYFDPSSETSHLNTSGAVSHGLRVGEESTGDGLVRVEDTTVDVTHSSYFGVDGRGSLIILDGGTLNNYRGYLGQNVGGYGSSQIIGSNSLWDLGGRLIVGDAGTGTLNITDGGKIKVFDAGLSDEPNMHAAVQAGSQADIDMDNGQLSVEGDMRLGIAGDADMDVLNGSQVDVAALILGDASSGSGTLTVDGPNTTFEADGPVLVGNHGEGQLYLNHDANFSGGHSFDSRGLAIGWENDGDGEVTIRNGATYDADNSVFVGASGRGRMDIESGGQLGGDNGILGANDGSFGHVDVADANTSWTLESTMTIGDGGTGILRVFYGAEVSAAQTALGEQTTGHGVIAVNGDDARFDAGNGFDIGISGAGEVEVVNGGELQANHTELGTFSGGSGSLLVDGDDSIFHSSSTLTVGGLGEGSVAIQNGGYVYAARVYLGERAGSTGTLTLNDFGSVLDARELHVGGEEIGPGGTGTLNVHSGTLVDVDETLTVYTDGTVNLFGGRINADELMFDGSTFNFNFGRLALGGDETLSNTKYNKLFPAGIREGQHLSIENRAILETYVSLEGGRLSVGELVNPFLLDFRRGTLDFTGDQGLTVGFTGPLGETLELGGYSQYGEPRGPQHVNVVDGDPDTTNTAAIAHEGLVIINPGSSFGGEMIMNEGEIQLRGPESRLNGDTIEGDGGEVHNGGLVVGAGRISATVHNDAGGEIRLAYMPTVSPEPIYLESTGSLSDPNTPPEARMVFTAHGNTNAGQINVGSHNTFDVLHDLANESGGTISLGYGSAMSVTDGLTNRGGVTITGDAAVYGDIDNAPNAGRLSVDNSSVGAFYGNVDNEGRVVVTDGSHAIFHGNVTGSGDYEGTGTVEFASNFSPGSSPGDVSFGGDVELPGTLIMEIAGLLQGVDYDHLDIAGNFDLAGTLDVQLLDGFDPDVGDTYNLFDFGSISGLFSSLDLPTLTEGRWDTSGLMADGTISVIPEPASVALMMLGGVTLLRRRRRD